MDHQLNCSRLTTLKKGVVLLLPKNVTWQAVIFLKWNLHTSIQIEYRRYSSFMHCSVSVDQTLCELLDTASNLPFQFLIFVHYVGTYLLSFTLIPKYFRHFKSILSNVDATNICKDSVYILINIPIYFKLLWTIKKKYLLL